jgi:hypothetical protein
MLRAVRTLGTPGSPPSMISPQKTKSPCFQPRFLNSGLDLRRPLLLQRAELPGICFRSNLSAASRTANRCLIILIIDTDRLVRDRQLTRIHPAKGKRKLAWRTLEPATTTSTRPVSPKPQDAFQVHNQHLSSNILARRDCSVGLGTRGRSPPASAHRHGHPFSVARRLPRHHHHAYIASTPASPQR